MANEAFKAWYGQGLQAVKTAADQGKAASGSAHAQSAPPEIRELMEGGAKVFGQHAETLGQLLQQAGGAGTGTPNPDEMKAADGQMTRLAEEKANKRASSGS